MTRCAVPVTVALVGSVWAAGCEPEETPVEEAEVMEVVRTPDERFDGLPDFPFSPHYALVQDALRMHYVDEGPRGGPVVVLLHGEPSWSYLYRHVIPFLVEAGYRVIAPDLVGFGRSDKPVRRDSHSYAAHVEWMRRLLFERLSLTRVHLFAQDWGGLIGLRLVAEHPDRFAAVALANTGLPTGDQDPGPRFRAWLEASQTMPAFDAGRIVQQGTVRELSGDEVAAYNAPFPDPTFQAAARVMPALVPTAPDQPGAAENRAAWTVLSRFEAPFLTLFSDRDPITRGWDAGFRSEVPGAAGQPHATVQNAGHFLQEDAPAVLASHLIRFFGRAGSPAGGV